MGPRDVRFIWPALYECVCVPILQEGRGEVEGEGHLFTLFFQRRPSTLHTYLAQESVLVVWDSQLGGLVFFTGTLPRMHGNLPSIIFLKKHKLSQDF